MSDRSHRSLNRDADSQSTRASAVDAVKEFFRGFLSVSPSAGG